MRFAIVLLAACAAVPAYSQERIFKASAIDLQQNERLDSLEDRVAALEGQTAKQEKIAVALPPPPSNFTAPVVVTAPPVVKVAPPVRAVTATPVQSSRYSTAELRSMIWSKRPGGWRGAVYADVSPRSMAKQHLVGPEHGFSWDQVNGLTQEEALILHDLAPRHGNQIFPMRSRQSSSGSVQVAQPVKRASQYSVTQSYNAGCANGQCANQTAYPMQSTARFPILRRLFR